MLKNLYLTGLATLLLAALGGLAYCLLLVTQENPMGLANLGKLLLVMLYSAYRLRAILDRRYQIYRPWESAQARRVKGQLHGAMGACLGLLALAVPAGLAGLIPLSQASGVLLASLLAVFLALETLNALNRNPMPAHDQVR